MIIQIQETKSPWELVCMDFLKALPPGADRSFNSSLSLFFRHRKATMFLPFHGDETAMETAIMIWNRVTVHTSVFQNIISDRAPKFTLALWRNLHSFVLIELSFSTVYQPHMYALAERMIQTLQDMIRRFCAYGLELKDSYGFTHYWFTLIQAL
ncbi:hypothetical protein O181_004716 [Austropuccinia psidii MF-1]|uniref:Integrase catalytic domain-containing protein n=1 Tax=Austropuccinia psidii MF-1 TaxID=1389203 RepID=A0A9Q3BG26_9BASI|nr:hypothetical protein [Austropuccinia psidii MF-1]